MSFHLYDFSELYSNASGTEQFIELRLSSNNNGEHQWEGHVLRVTDGVTTHEYTFPNDLPSSQTANTFVLIATQAWATANPGITPDFIIPSGFLLLGGGTISVIGGDSLTYAALPTNGDSVNRNGNPGTPSPMNFDPNSLPTVETPLPDQSINPGELYNFQVPTTTFDDADGDTLSYSAAQSNGSALPSWLTFTAGTRTFSGTPDTDDAAISASRFRTVTAGALRIRSH